MNRDGDYWEKVDYETEDWLIAKRCHRGYEPYYTLHKRRRLFWISWWSAAIKRSCKKDNLIAFCDRYDSFPEYCDKE